MKLGMMWCDVWRSLWKRPFTEKYPLEKRPTPERARGALRWSPEGCTGCALCSKDCPANAIDLITLDKKAKRFVLRYHMDRCAFCGQCVQSCRFHCLEMPNEEWELAAVNREPFTVLYGREEDLQQLLAGSPAEESQLTAEE
jgi:formate hydrogenlyase subunit 6/NADH:ubiquinone oxidoreductase subunit I